MSKSKMNDQILTYLIDIKTDVAGIKEHLKTLNGKVVDQKERISILEKDNEKNKLGWAKLSGVVLGLSIVGSVVGNKLLEVFSFTW